MSTAIIRQLTTSTQTVKLLLGLLKGGIAGCFLAAAALALMLAIGIMSEGMASRLTNLKLTKAVMLLCIAATVCFGIAMAGLGSRNLDITNYILSGGQATLAIQIGGVEAADGTNLPGVSIAVGAYVIQEMEALSVICTSNGDY